MTALGPATAMRMLLAVVVVACSACVHFGASGPYQFPRTDHVTSGDLLEALPLETAPVPGPIREVYPRGLSLTMVSEGWRSLLYNDVANFCTIGYGHLVKKRPCDGTEPANFRAGLSEPDGAALLVADMANARATVSDAITITLTDGQYAALCDFVFNVGSTNFRNSTLRILVNSGQDNELPAQFRRWVLAGGKAQPGLKIRREREIDLYFDGRRTPRVFEALEQLQLLDIRTGEKRE